MYTTFSKALEAAKNDKKAFRKEWVGKYISLVRAEESGLYVPFIGIHFEDVGNYIPWTPTQYDMLANDWVVIED